MDGKLTYETMDKMYRDAAAAPIQPEFAFFSTKERFIGLYGQEEFDRLVKEGRVCQPVWKDGKLEFKEVS